MLTRKELNHIHDKHLLIKENATIVKTIQKESIFLSKTVRK